MHFAILQVPSEKLPLDYFFGAPVPSKMYETTWERESLEDLVEPEVSINEILVWAFRKFNLDRPDDFKGRSLSVGDVVRVGDQYFKVQMVGFEDVTELFSHSNEG